MAFCPSRSLLNKRLLPSFGEMKLGGNASIYVYLYYLIFMRKLANAAHAETFGRRSISLRPQDVAQVSGKLCREFSFLHRLGQRRVNDASHRRSSKTKKLGAGKQKPSLKTKKHERAVPHKTSLENYMSSKERVSESSEQETSNFSLILSESDDAPAPHSSSSDVY